MILACLLNVMPARVLCVTYNDSDPSRVCNDVQSYVRKPRLDELVGTVLTLNVLLRLRD